MKYNILGFYQPRAVELGLDGNDLLVLRWFVDYAGTNKMRTILMDNKMYYWVNYAIVLEELPILKISKQTLAKKHFGNLVKANVLEHKFVKEGGSFSYYCYGINYDTLIYLQTDGGSVEINLGSVENNDRRLKSTYPSVEINLGGRLESTYQINNIQDNKNSIIEKDNKKTNNRIVLRKDSPQSEIAPTQDEPEIDTIPNKKPTDFNPLDFIEHQNSSTVSFVEKEKENTPLTPSNEKDTAEEIDTEEFSELFQNPEREDTSKFLSKKMSTEDAQEVLDYWNSKDIIKHRKFTQDYLKNFSLISEKYPVEKIKEAINNYSIVLKTSDFWTYKWTLEDFIRVDKKDTSPCEDFFNEGKHWINFGKKYPGVKKNIAANIYTHKEIRDAALKGELSPEMVKKFLEEQRQKSIEASKVKNKIYI